MPVLKIQHILSFSSEDSVHPTTNILTLNPSKTWRCREPGEKSAYIILQLEKVSLITGIDIGNDHSAFIEVLVARTGNDNKFEVLLPTSSLMTPMESRNSSTCNRVRMFMTEHFVSETRNQKWDQIKFVCSQPFNTHITYGLAFVKIQGSNGTKNHNLAEDDKVMTKNCDQMIGRFRFREDSPEDITLSAGSLFARRKELMQSEPNSLKPAAAIREASNIINQKLSINQSISKQNISSPNTSKVKHKNESSKKIHDIEPTKINRNRDELLYNSEDMESNERLEKLLERDKSRQELQKRILNENSASASKKVKLEKTKIINNNESSEANKLKSSHDMTTNTIAKVNKKSEKKNLNSSLLSNEENTKTKDYTSNKKELSKICKTPDLSKPHKPKDRHQQLYNQKSVSYKPFNHLFKGVIFVLSGFQNPLRADLRKMALDMGASYQSDWNIKCTHLICAFPNTPKYQQVLGKGKIVKRSWIEDCHTQRKYIPWRRYSLVSSDASKDESDNEILDISSLPSSSNSNGSILNENSSDCDSEEEIRRIKKKISDKNNTKMGSLDPFELSTEIEEEAQGPKLNFFSGKTFYLDENLGAVAAIKLKRYIVLFGGKISKTLHCDVDYNITQENKTSQDVPNVQPEWVFECNDMEMLLPITRYLL